jgi:6-phosphogluconolactonase
VDAGSESGHSPSGYALTKLAPPFELGLGASWQVADLDNRIVYTVSGTTQLAAVAYTVSPTDGRTTLAAVDNTTWAQPVAADGGTLLGIAHVSLSKSSKYILMAGYVSGSVAALPLAAAGKFGMGAPTISQHVGRSSCPVDQRDGAGARGQAPHPHSVVRGPGASPYLYVPDLGLDKVFQYALDEVTGELEVVGATDTAPCAGPRHLAFHTPSASYAYVVHEMGNAVAVHAIAADGALAVASQTVSTVPLGWGYCHHIGVDGSGNCTKAAEVRTTRDGRFLFASNRGADTIVRMEILAGGAMLGPAVVVANVGWVRGMELTPDSSFLLTTSDGGADYSHITTTITTSSLRHSGDGSGAAGGSRRRPPPILAGSGAHPASRVDTTHTRGNGHLAANPEGMVRAFAVDPYTGALTEVAETAVLRGCDVTFLGAYGNLRNA